MIILLVFTEGREMEECMTLLVCTEGEQMEEYDNTACVY